MKRIRQNEKKRLRNRTVKTRMKNTVKSVRASEGEADTVEKLNLAKSIIAKAAKKGVIHKSTAARKISRLQKFVNKMNA